MCSEKAKKERISQKKKLARSLGIYLVKSVPSTVSGLLKHSLHLFISIYTLAVLKNNTTTIMHLSYRRIPLWLLRDKFVDGFALGMNGRHWRRIRQKKNLYTYTRSSGLSRRHHCEAAAAAPALVGHGSFTVLQRVLNTLPPKPT